MRVWTSAVVALLLTFSNIAAAQTLDEVETFAVTSNDTVFVEGIDERQMAIDCLASNIYYEARGEPEKGQIAVGIVTINRVKDQRWPDDLCEVVREPWQFSWYRPGKIARIRETSNMLYLKIREMATDLYDKYYAAGHKDDVTHGATHFHTTSVNPSWRGKVKIARIGNHVFFRVGR